MTVCAACGTDNRDKARYCRGCARPLPSGLGPAPEPGAPAGTTTPHRPQRRVPRETPEAHPPAVAPVAGRSPRRGLAGLVVLALGLATVWWAVQPGAPSPAPPVPTPAATVLASPVSQAATAEVARPPVPASSPPQAVVAQHLVPASPSTVTSTAALAREPRAPAPPVRVQPPRPHKASASAPSPSRGAARPAQPAVNAAAAVPAAAAAPAPSPALTVDQTCAGSSNFLSRDFCRVRACRNPAVAGDPVCVRFREMEAASRRRMDQ